MRDSCGQRYRTVDGQSRNKKSLLMQAFLFFHQWLQVQGVFDAAFQQRPISAHFLPETYVDANILVPER